MVKLVVDQADAKQLPCWLFSRPSAERIYLASGFVSKGTADISTEEVSVAPFHSMLREAAT